MICLTSYPLFSKCRSQIYSKRTSFGKSELVKHLHIFFANSINMRTIAVSSCLSFYLMRPGLCLGLQEGQQVGIDLILMRGREAMRCTWIKYLSSAFDKFHRLDCRVLDGNNLVVLAVYD